MAWEIKAVCPSCEYEVDGASEVSGGDDLPEPGDVALCIRCAMPAIYAENEDSTLGLRAPTSEEKVQLFTDNPDITKTQAAILAHSMWFQQ